MIRIARILAATVAALTLAWVPSLGMAEAPADDAVADVSLDGVQLDDDEGKAPKKAKKEKKAKAKKEKKAAKKAKKKPEPAEDDLEGDEGGDEEY